MFLLLFGWDLCYSSLATAYKLKGLCLSLQDLIWSNPWRDTVHLKQPATAALPTGNKSAQDISAGQTNQRAENTSICGHKHPIYQEISVLAVSNNNRMNSDT